MADSHPNTQRRPKSAVIWPTAIAGMMIGVVRAEARVGSARGTFLAWITAMSATRDADDAADLTDLTPP